MIWLCGVNAIDAPTSEVDEVDIQAESLWGIESNLAIGLDAEVESAVLNSLPDFDYGFGRGRNIHVLGLLFRGVGNAGSAANEDQLTAQFGTDQASGGREAFDNGFTERFGDGDVGRHGVRDKAETCA